MKSTQRLIEIETGRVIAPRLERATSLWSRAVGLLGRRSLESGGGMWFEPCHSIHTFGMRFAIDVLFLDREGRVLHLAANARPWRILPPVRGARVVVELPAGEIAARSLNRSSRLRLEP